MMSREEAIRAARLDSANLITPAARKRALKALTRDQTKVGLAAKLILTDGGQQQGLFTRRRSCTMSEWGKAAETLGVR